MKGEVGSHFCVVVEPDSIGSFQFFCWMQRTGSSNVNLLQKTIPIESNKTGEWF